MVNIRLMLVDDHRMLREGLRGILQKVDDITLVADSDDGVAAIDLARQLKPDVVVIGLGPAGKGGAEAARRILAENPAVKVIALSAVVDKRSVLQMLRAGASGYVDKSARSEDLLRGIRAVANGETYLYAEAATAVVDSVRRNSLKAHQSEVLGRREREVLHLLAGGRSSAQIAEALGIATGTVEVHRRNIMRKLDLHNVADLTRFAIREGLASA